MDDRAVSALKNKMDAESFSKLEALGNERVWAFVADSVDLFRPDHVKVCDDSPEDIAFIRNRAVETGEEASLAIEGHTIHFDGYHDQARDKKATKYLVPEGMDLGERLNSVERNEGLAEIRGILAGAMAGKTAYVRVFCLGPVGSKFSIPCVQITDSAYVAHSEDMLYRNGYENLKNMGPDAGFFRFLHSGGRLENNVCADVDKRRIYIDLAEETVYSANTQYAGNTVGLKKLAFRLAIRKADSEGWLAEHMFIMGVKGPSRRVTYFSGAFPSACGKTSTAMLPGETIVGDDLAYFRRIEGQVRAVNVESGIFGIIRDVNANDDPLIFDVLNKPGEVIFSNVLVVDKKPYWLGMGKEIPTEGVNHSGRWSSGNKDEGGNEISPSHKNARYTVRLEALGNLDPNWDLPEGVPIGGFIYGGRDSDTCVPVMESFDWSHGIVTMGASLESETTAATLGAEGVRTFCLMSILDFLAIPLGKYIQNNLDFGNDLTKTPKIFGTNYFLKAADGQYLNGKLDKDIWVKWMELRVHGEVEAIRTPVGLLPIYDDLKRLFREVLDKQYTQDQYVQQFTIRIPENLAKIDRVEGVYHRESDTPKIIFEALAAQRKRLEALQTAKGDYISPLDL